MPATHLESKDFFTDGREKPRKAYSYTKSNWCVWSEAQLSTLNRRKLSSYFSCNKKEENSRKNDTAKTAMICFITNTYSVLWTVKLPVSHDWGFWFIFSISCRRLLMLISNFNWACHQVISHGTEVLREIVVPFEFQPSIAHLVLRLLKALVNSYSRPFSYLSSLLRKRTWRILCIRNCPNQYLVVVFALNMPTVFSYITFHIVAILTDGLQYDLWRVLVRQNLLK